MDTSPYRHSRSASEVSVDESVISELDNSSPVKYAGTKHDISKLKAVILVGGPAEGTRFRPLSLRCPKPRFPIAGKPMIYHHIKAASKVEGLSEVLIVGSYPESEFMDFVSQVRHELNISVRYLREYTALGTAGGIYHFRDLIWRGKPDAFFVMHADVCSDFPLNEMLNFHKSVGNGSHCSIMSVQALKSQANNYGCLAIDKSGMVMHYVEKPQSFVSHDINCGIYLLSPSVFEDIQEVFVQNHSEDGSGSEEISFERDILPCLVQDGRLYAFQSKAFWSQLKTAGSALYGSRHYLENMRATEPEALAKNKEGSPSIVGDVIIHESAEIDPTAKIGPNVTIGPGVRVREGARIRDAILLSNVEVKEHCCVLNSIIGWDTVVGKWSRIEGMPIGVDPNDPTTHVETLPLFSPDGKLNPAISVVGDNVTIAPETIVMHAIVLPHKKLAGSHKNEIIL